MEWFNRHLNWTYSIAAIYSYVMLIIGGVATVLSNFAWPFFIGHAVFLIINMAVGGWVLKKKGQSLWLLVLAVFIYLAFVLLVLLLKNNRTGQGGIKKIIDAEYYQGREPEVK